MKVYIESKDDIVEGSVDDRGRISLGSEYAGADVQIAVLEAVGADGEGVQLDGEAVDSFIDDCTESASGYTPKEDIFKAYSEYAEANGLPDLSPTRLGRLLSEKGAVSGGRRVRIGGGRKYVYDGIALTNTGIDYLDAK